MVVEDESRTARALAEQELTRVSADLLPRLNALVSSLLGWLTVQGDLNPLKPAAFARALRAVLVQLVVDLVSAPLHVVCFLQTLYGSGPFFHLLLRLLALA